MIKRNWQYETANDLAKEFIEFVKDERTELQGKLVTKSSIRAKYKISSSTATLMFSILTQYGFENSQSTIRCPVFEVKPTSQEVINKKQEQQEQSQQQSQEENKEASDLELILNDD